MGNERVQITNRYPAIQGLSEESAKLIDTMKNGKAGDEFSDDQLTKLIGKDTSPSGNGYGYLDTAIRRVRSDHRVVWQRVRGAGVVRCLGADEVYTSAAADVTAIRRRAKVAAQKVGTVDLENVPVKERPKFTGMMAQLGALRMFSKADVAKQLETNKPKALPDSILAAFR